MDVRLRLLALLLLLVLPACSASTADPVAGAAEKPQQEPLKAELDTMVVPSGDIGGLPRDLRVTPDSGWVDNAAQSAGSIDPNDSADSLRQAGRISGYELTYYDPTQAAAKVGAGLLSISTWVELFKSESAASAYLRARVTYFGGLSGKSPEKGISFKTVKVFSTEVGDEAHGLREDALFGSEHVFRTRIAFRRGKIVAGVMLVRADGENASADAERVAGTLDSRIQNALMGSINEDPVLIPEDGVPLDGQQPTSTKPSGEPDLTVVALTPADLPQGMTGEPGRYTRTTSPRISFRREFFPQGAAIGHTRIIGLTSEVNLFESEAAASASQSLTLASLLSGDGAKQFATNLAATSGLQATHVRTKRVQIDGAVGLLTTFDTQAGPLVNFYAIAQRGRGTTSLEAFCARTGFDQHDLVPLLNKVAARLDRTLG